MGDIENIDESTTHDTIQEAIDEANEGDTIEVESGVYVGFDLDKTDVTVIGKSGAVIENDPDENDGQVILSGSGATIEGFEFDGDFTHAAGAVGVDSFENADGSMFRPLILVNGNDATVEGTTIDLDRSDYSGSEIAVQLDGDDATVAESTLQFDDVTAGTGQPIVEVTGVSCEITGNTLSRNIGGWVMQGVTVSVTDNTFDGDERHIGFTGGVSDRSPTM